MTTLIIKGAIYKDGDEILRPHYTGEFTAVECDEYKTREEIKANYSANFYREATGKDAEVITHEGVKYYRCEWGPRHTEDFELLSDLSNLEYFDEETIF